MGLTDAMPVKSYHVFYGNEHSLQCLKVVPLLPVMSHMNPVHTPTPNPISIRATLLLFMPRSSKWSFAFGFSY